MVLVYTESEGGQYKKVALEAVSYARGIADAMGTSVTAVAVNGGNADDLGKYGASKVLEVSNGDLESFNAEAYADIVAQAAQQEGAQVVVVSTSANSKFMAPLLAVNLNAGYVTNVTELPLSTAPFKVKSNVFTNKAFAVTEIKTDTKLVGLAKNAYGLKEDATAISSEAFSPSVSNGNVNVVSVDRATDKVTIADAEVVVSGGRGLKGPENWGVIEDLAKTLGAATGCSKPVSDMDWRPHHEHVGQTGVKVSPTLYVAVGISGAIQHLAGVNSSKYIVVINKDEEAPFFKAADYGIVGDAFEVLPKLTAALQEAMA